MEKTQIFETIQNGKPVTITADANGVPISTTAVARQGRMAVEATREVTGSSSGSGTQSVNFQVTPGAGNKKVLLGDSVGIIALEKTPDIWDAVDATVGGTYGTSTAKIIQKLLGAQPGRIKTIIYESTTGASQGEKFQLIRSSLDSGIQIVPVNLEEDKNNMAQNTKIFRTPDTWEGIALNGLGGIFLTAIAGDVVKITLIFDRIGDVSTMRRP